MCITLRGDEGLGNEIGQVRLRLRVENKPSVSSEADRTGDHEDETKDGGELASLPQESVSLPPRPPPTLSEETDVGKHDETKYGRKAVPLPQQSVPPPLSPQHESAGLDEETLDSVEHIEVADASISMKEVEILCEQCNVTHEEAIAALRESGGDLANAVVHLIDTGIAVHELDADTQPEVDDESGPQPEESKQSEFESEQDPAQDVSQEHKHRQDLGQDQEQEQEQGQMHVVHGADVTILCQTCNVTPEQAAAALKETGGDLAQAVTDLVDAGTVEIDGLDV